MTYRTLRRILGYTDTVLKYKPTKRDGEDSRDLATYTIDEAALFLGMPSGTLRKWFCGVDPLLTPALIVRSFVLLSFRNLVDAHIVQAARNYHKVPMQRIRDALVEAESEAGSKHPLQDKNIKIFARCLVRIEPGRGKRKRSVVNLSLHGQRGIPEVVELYTRRIVVDASGSPIALYPWRHWQTDDTARPVSISPNVMSGRLVVRGTRIPLAVLATEARDRTPEDLARDFNLSVDLVREALSHFDRKAA